MWGASGTVELALRRSSFRCRVNTRALARCLTRLCWLCAPSLFPYFVVFRSRLNLRWIISIGCEAKCSRSVPCPTASGCTAHLSRLNGRTSVKRTAHDSLLCKRKLYISFVQSFQTHSESLWIHPEPNSIQMLVQTIAGR